MSLTAPQFDVLSTLATSSDKPISQRALVKCTHRALGAVNAAMKELQDKKFVCDKRITDKGVEALEPYRVKRAVFLAAGFGSRLIPITFNTPKPLVRVNGTRIIDTLLDAVVAAGITDITVVRGYLAEQFDQLLYKYPMIKFIDNAAYNTANNISSAYCARFLLKNAYVIESDLLLKNPKLITPYQYTTNYLGFHVEKTDDWCFTTGTKGRIVKMGVGGLDCEQMVGISYWNEKDGATIAEDIRTVFEMPGGKERYWDQVALDQYIDKYDVQVRPCYPTDVTEIDTFAELCSIDKLYRISK